LRLIRARTLLYVALLALVSGIMLVAWLSRSVLEINVLQDRSPAFVRLSDGGVRNGYTVKILNKLHEPREFQLEARGLPGARLTIVGMEGEASPSIQVATDNLRELRVLVALPPDRARALQQPISSFDLVIRDKVSGLETVRRTRFQGS
jgi:polyferredoxin